MLKEDMSKGVVVFSLSVFFIILICSIVSATPTFFAIPKQALNNASFSVALKQPLDWKNGVDTYSLTFQGIQAERALVFLNVSGKMFRFTLAPDKPLNLDVTEDKQPDGSITLVKLEANKAEFRMNSLTEQTKVVSKESSEVTSSTENTVKLSAWIFIGGIGLIVLLIIVVGWFILRKKNTSAPSV